VTSTCTLAQCEAPGGHADFKTAVSTGSLRRRLPVAAKIALVTAGAIVAVPGSPIRPGASVLSTRKTSMAGASLIRSGYGQREAQQQPTAGGSTGFDQPPTRETVLGRFCFQAALFSRRRPFDLYEQSPFPGGKSLPRIDRRKIGPI
jgi:hypothetical protein